MDDSEVVEVDETAVEPDSCDVLVWWPIPPGYGAIADALIVNVGAVCVRESVPGPLEALSIVETDMYRGCCKTPKPSQFSCLSGM
jgi:hypothetical protein